MQQIKTGILLVNLGTPEAAEPAAVRKYLAEFLWDPRVVEISRPIWWLILNGIILRLRPKKSAKAYQRIWQEQGSPLLTIGQLQAQALQSKLQQQGLQSFKVELAMRYGKPSIKSALERLQAQDIKKLIILPLYPQPSGATTCSVFDAVTAALKPWRFLPELHFINEYATQAAYIQALATSVRNHWQQHGQAERLVISFHGIPEFQVAKGDRYQHYCEHTATQLRQALQLTQAQAPLVFQSRFGKAKWLQPYFSDKLKELAEENVKCIDVICPGFAADCLETLDEVANEYNAEFKSLGGEKLRYIPALNDSAQHIELLASLLKK